MAFLIHLLCVGVPFWGRNDLAVSSSGYCNPGPAGASARLYVSKSDNLHQERLKRCFSAPIEPGRNREAQMEIGPIPGIRAVAVVRASQGDLRPPAIFDIDATAKPGDDPAQRNGRKAAGAEEDAEEDLMLDVETE